MTRKTRYTAEIDAVAAKFGFNPLFVEAFVLQESGGNTDAFRFEAMFWNRYLKTNPLYAGQNPRRVSSSYGLMQILHPVAVERGLSKELAPELLFLPEVGLEWGCQQLQFLWTWAHSLGVDDDQARFAAVAAYNGGRGGNDPTKNTPLRSAKYARAVLALYASLK